MLSAETAAINISVKIEIQIANQTLIFNSLGISKYFLFP
jgi:hypothetical protein